MWDEVQPVAWAEGRMQVRFEYHLSAQQVDGRVWEGRCSVLDQVPAVAVQSFFRW